MWPFTHWLRRADSDSKSADSILLETPVRGRVKGPVANRRLLQLEQLEERIVPSFADGNGAVITNLAEQNNGSQLVITFDGPLNADPANPVQSPTNTANYSVQVPAANPEVITSIMSSVSISSATYNSATFQVTLNFGSVLAQGSTYRVFINGTASVDSAPQPGLIDSDGNTIDGDYDDTASGNFYALFAWAAAGTPLNFSDSAGDQVTLSITGPGQLESWRTLDGDFDASDLTVQAGLTAGAIQQLTVANGVLGQTTLSGSAAFAAGNSVVVVPSIAGQGINFTNALPSYFQLAAAPLPASPAPVVATSSKLPYTIEIQQVSSNLPAVQSAVAAQDNVASSPFNGYWLMFGGRDNGLHNFNPTDDFPPQQQNEDLIVVDPATWQSWTLTWSATDIPAAMAAPLYSTNQESFQRGDSLFVVGGYGALDQGGGNFGAYTTYNTLTALSVDGLINAVVNGGDVAALSQIQQIQDSRLQVTGGAMQLIGNQAFLVLGQDFQGEYFSPTATQTYTDEIQSFQINYNGAVTGSLGISNYQAQIDQVNFRRRDYDFGSIISSSQQPALEVFGGVFTPGASTDPNAGLGYRTPIVVNGIGATQVGPYQQFFSQYSAPNIGLYSAGTNSMFNIFLGGISLYDYNFATGQLTEDDELPFVDDVTTFMQGPDGVSQEFEMPSQLPGLYGSEASFFASPGLPQYGNGVIQLDQLTQPITLGYMFGGIFSTVPNTTDPATQTSATNALFRVVLTPKQQVAPIIYYAVAEIPSQGVSLYSSSIGWKTISGATATSLASDANGDVVGEFPNFYGVWIYQTSTNSWANLTQANACQVAVAGNGIVVGEFPGFFGVWRYESSTGWENLTQAHASSLSVDAKGDVVGEFPNYYGVWLYTDAAGWTNITQANASEVHISSNGIVVGEFPDFFGVWRYETSVGWQNLTPENASSFCVNTNGEVVGVFPSDSGVWLCSDANGWANINLGNASTVIFANNESVFGLFDDPQGIWTYQSSTAWLNITPLEASLLGTVG
jgi:hypothetical protein